MPILRMNDNRDTKSVTVLGYSVKREKKYSIVAACNEKIGRITVLMPIWLRSISPFLDYSFMPRICPILDSGTADISVFMLSMVDTIVE